MALGYARHQDLTITTCTSNVIYLFDDRYAIGIVAPASLTSTAITIMVSHGVTSSGTFGTLQSGGSDVVITAGKAIEITPTPFRALYLQGSSTEAASRTFEVGGVYQT